MDCLVVTMSWMIVSLIHAECWQSANLPICCDGTTVIKEYNYAFVTFTHFLISLEFFWKKYKQLYNWHRTKIIANIYWVIIPDTMLNRIYIFTATLWFRCYCYCYYYYSSLLTKRSLGVLSNLYKLSELGVNREFKTLVHVLVYCFLCSLYRK